MSNTNVTATQTPCTVRVCEPNNRVSVSQVLSKLTTLSKFNSLVYIYFYKLSLAPCSPWITGRTPLLDKPTLPPIHYIYMWHAVNKPGICHRQQYRSRGRSPWISSFPTCHVTTQHWSAVWSVGGFKLLWGGTGCEGAWVFTVEMLALLELCTSLHLWPWANSFPSLGFHFLIYKMFEGRRMGLIFKSPECFQIQNFLRLIDNWKKPHTWPHDRSQAKCRHNKKI